MPRRAGDGAAAGRRAGRGARGVRRTCPVGANLALSTRRPAARWRRRTRAGRVDDALEQVGLGGVDERPVRAYSLGMRQRLGLAAALLRAPAAAGARRADQRPRPAGHPRDPALLLDLNRAGTTVFLSSHLLAEVEQLCTRVGVLDRGRLVLQDQLDDLRGRPGARSCARRTPTPRRALLDGRVERPRRRPARGSAPTTRSRSTRCWSAGASGVAELGPSGARSRTIVLEADRAERVDRR